MTFKGIISDLDGVIVNTVKQHFRSWRLMFAEYGVNLTFEDYQKKLDGIPRQDGARNILPHFDETQIEAASAKKQAYFLEEIRSGVQTYPPTVALFEELQQRGIKLAAISSSKNCETILHSVGLYEMFLTVITGNDVSRGKPDPQVFLMAAERLGLSPSECVVFEDANLGVEAAKRGGFRCVGIDRHNSPRLLAKADLIVEDLGEIGFDTLVRICESRTEA